MENSVTKQEEIRFHKLSAIREGWQGKAASDEPTPTIISVSFFFWRSNFASRIIQFAFYLGEEQMKNHARRYRSTCCDFAINRPRWFLSLSVDTKTSILSDDYDGRSFKRGVRNFEIYYSRDFKRLENLYIKFYSILYVIYKMNNTLNLGRKSCRLSFLRLSE